MSVTPPPLRLLQTPRRHRLPVVAPLPSWPQRCAATLQRAWAQARGRLTMQR